jgi:Zn-dependent protease
VLNVLLALFFIGLEFIAPIRQFYSFLAVSGVGFAGYGMINGILHVWRFGAAMNIILALFNMIPAFPFDGSKVFAWNWAAGLFFLALLLYLGTIVIGPGILIMWPIMAVIFMILSRLAFR